MSVPVEGRRSILERFNSIAKIDSNGEIYKKVVFDSPIIKIGPRKLLRQREVHMKVSEEEKKRISSSRAKNKIRDYAMVNQDLKFFVTYTLSPKLAEDRYDEKKIYKQMRDWLSDRVKRNDLKYVLVPEEHKDGAWHFHGFVNKDLEWKYGFKKVVEMGEGPYRGPMVSYATSYINKNAKKFNGRYYLHSKNLKEPGKFYDNVDFEGEEGYYCELGQAGIKAKIIQ